MNLRHKRRNSHIQSIQHNYKPVLGLLSHTATLNCNIHPQQHEFNIDFQHPLEILTKLTKQCKKYAFDKLVQAIFDIKIEQKTTFLPEALLTGNYEIIHEYKKMIERSRIGSYIRLNIKHQQKSYQKKKPLSLDLRTKQQDTQSARNIIFAKVFNQKTVNQRSTKKITQHITVNDTKHSYEARQEQTLTPVKKDRSFTTSKVSIQNSKVNKINKINEENINIRYDIKQHRDTRTVNHTHIHNNKQSKSNKKSRDIEGIKINYIAIKGSQQNPQTSTFIYKSTATKTNRQLSQFGTKTDILSPHIIHFDKTLDNHISFSVHNENDKISMHSQFKQNDDNLSEKYQKSLKNSEMSQLTHNEMYTNNYFFNQRKILKKGRKSVFVQNFEKREIL